MWQRREPRHVHPILALCCSVMVVAKHYSLFYFWSHIFQPSTCSSSIITWTTPEASCSLKNTTKKGLSTYSCKESVMVSKIYPSLPPLFFLAPVPNRTPLYCPSPRIPSLTPPSPRFRWWTWPVRSARTRRAPRGPAWRRAPTSTSPSPRWARSSPR